LAEAIRKYIKKKKPTEGSTGLDLTPGVTEYEAGVVTE